MEKLTLSHLREKITDKYYSVTHKMGFVGLHKDVQKEVAELKKYLSKVHKKDYEFLKVRLDSSAQRIKSAGFENLAASDLETIARCELYHSDISEFKEKCGRLAYKIDRLYK